jgi:PEP-CTERM motif
MKSKIIVIAIFSSFVSSVFAASTLNISNFTSATAGAPIIDELGAALPAGTYFANGGIFSGVPNFATATIESIRGSFTPIDTTPIFGGIRNGLFTGQTFNGTLPVGFAGSPAYLLVSNNSDFALATAVVVFNLGVNYTAPDALGNSGQTLSATTATLVYGSSRAVTVQPTNVAGANFANGVVLSAIPEPSSVFLGAVGVLGILRRRRN